MYMGNIGDKMQQQQDDTLASSNEIQNTQTTNTLNTNTNNLNNNNTLGSRTSERNLSGSNVAGRDMVRQDERSPSQIMDTTNNKSFVNTSSNNLNTNGNNADNENKIKLNIRINLKDQAEPHVLASIVDDKNPNMIRKNSDTTVTNQNTDIRNTLNDNMVVPKKMEISEQQQQIITGTNKGDLVEVQSNMIRKQEIVLGNEDKDIKKTIIILLINKNKKLKIIIIY